MDARTCSFFPSPPANPPGRVGLSFAKESSRMNESERKQLVADVEAFCQEIRPVEELCYVEHRFNDQVLPLARKYGLLGMPLPERYGGRDADTVTYARALARNGREGTGVRTFFSGPPSTGEYPILTCGAGELKQRY